MAVYYLRKVLNPFMLKCAALGVGLSIFGSLVHTANVIANMPAFNDVVGLSRFSYYAFVDTNFTVQTITVALLAVGVWIVRDIKNTFASRAPRAYSPA